MYKVARLGVFIAISVLRPPDTVACRRLACGFLITLLRSGALHAASRQLAALVDYVEAAAVDAAAARPAAEGPAANRSVHKYVGRSLPALVYTITFTACDLAMPSSPDEGPQQRALCAELVAALEDSWALEHAARTLILQTRTFRDMSIARSATSGALMALSWLHGSWSGDAKDADAARLAARLRFVASGRCVQHAARCIGLAVLCDAEGGSAYGLPPELLASPPSGQEAGGSGPVGGEMSEDAVVQLRAMVCMMQLGGDPAPPGRRGALALAMRVGRLAMASTRSRATGEGGGGGNDDAASGSSGASAPAAVAALGPRWSVPQAEVFPLAADALQAAWRFLVLPRAVAQAASAAAVAEAVDWWRLAAAVVDRAVPCLTVGAGLRELFSFGGRLAVDWGLLPDCGVLSLPAEAPPALAAALDGGLLRCLELLMRRAGRDPQGPEAMLLQGLVFRVCGCQVFWSYLAPLLAYGEPRQAAALLATMRKLLRTVNSRALGSEDLDSEANLHDCILFTITAVLAAVVKQAEVTAAAAPGDDPSSPASQQLLSLLSCTACEWLPELSQSLSHSYLSNGMATPGRLAALAAWLPLLAGRCVVPPYAAAGRSPPVNHDDDGGGVSGEAADDGGWRALLMEEVGAVPLMDALLRMVPRAAELRPESRLPLLRSLVAACCAVAAVFVESAGIQEPAAAAAVAGPSGTAAVAPPAVPPLPWPGWLLREAAAGLRSCGDQDMAAHAEGLAAYLELGGDGACEALRQASPPPGPLVSALPPPIEARRLLPGRCANPRCNNLEGDSEADLTLKACAGCGAVGYCCRPCQTAHWRAGHNGECARMRRNGGR
ncbi:hypothetical protein GPECTOR_29g88 [Gonium pectorale]|uniref:phytol kinase n=1 Tax=Gonium pectorale TaxID=33097 RepID=A0A150GEV9_GONPE|nr:hypothetical protein GPECTOR_29g88 [Gonium pectorale]|eukprot:KXZ48313.1 hypothetical protein GPECTOR_29g88 [Gonium pectorale]